MPGSKQGDLEAKWERSLCDDWRDSNLLETFAAEMKNHYNGIREGSLDRGVQELGYLG